MTDRSPHWENVYATKGEAEVSWFQDNPAISLAMIRAATADHSAGIIDIGGGASRLVDAPLHEGYRDLAVLDLSAVPALRASIGERNCTVWPSSLISPSSGRIAPEMALIIEDLPAPLSPMTARISPG